VVATRASFVQGAAAALQTWERSDDGWADALLLACFGDPGLAALREVSRVPVLGMAESALSVALSLHKPFHIITAGAAWDAMLRETLQLHPGAMRWFDGITLLETTGRTIANDPQAFLAQVQAAVDGLAARNLPTCILGGAGFAPLLPQIRYAGTLVDGLGAALQQLAALRLP
jgi:allantoin racemase